MNTQILLDHEPVADGGYLVRALLRVTGEAPEASDRPPLNLSVVLDRSGSMGYIGKLDRAKEAASLLVRRLGDDDVTSVVAYDDDVRTIAGRTLGAQRHELLSRIDMIGIGGMTNLSGGWLRGRELVAEELVARGEGGAVPDGGVSRSEGDTLMQQPVTRRIGGLALSGSDRDSGPPAAEKSDSLGLRTLPRRLFSI